MNKTMMLHSSTGFLVKSITVQNIRHIRVQIMDWDLSFKSACIRDHAQDREKCLEIIVHVRMHHAQI